MLSSARRATVAILVLATPVVAQSTLGPYAPTDAKYHVVTSTKTSQVMMGQAQEFESKGNQLVSLAVAKSGDALSLTMTVDSATASTTSPEGAPDLQAAIGMKLTGVMAPDGKVASSAVTDKSGAPSTSPLATGFRSILPRLMVGAAVGATWADTSSYVTKREDGEVTTSTVANYVLAGDTVVAGARAWKITGTSATKLTGHGNRMGTDYALTGDVKGLVTVVVSTAGMLLGETADADSNITVTVEAAGMTIPIVQKTTTAIEKLP